MWTWAGGGIAIASGLVGEVASSECGDVLSNAKMGLPVHGG